MTGRFRNRVDAGNQLADRLRTAPRAARGPAAEPPDVTDSPGTPGAWAQPPVVLGLPRGGMPVAGRVAEALDAPLDVLVIRKVGVPWQPELALGAVGESGARVLNPAIVASTGLSDPQIDALSSQAADEVELQLKQFRGGRPAVPLEGRDVIVVDDGIATGATMRAAVDVVHARSARSVTVAVPVAAAQSLPELRRAADEVVCLLAPDDLRGVGLWYADFRQTSDAEVVDLLAGV